MTPRPHAMSSLFRVFLCLDLSSYPTVGHMMSYYVIDNHYVIIMMTSLVERKKGLDESHPIPKGICFCYYVISRRLSES